MRLHTAALAAGTLAIGTDGFVIAGVLPNVARSFRVPVGRTGLMVTCFALAYAVSAPIAAVVCARRDRRRLLVTSMIGLAAANVAAAASPLFTVLLACRVVAALFAAVFSPMALAVAVEASPEDERARAASVVLGGMTLALVAGVPVGSLLGDSVGWRWTFVFVAVVAAAAAVGVGTLLPPLRPADAVDLRARLNELRRSEVWWSLLALFLWVAGALSVYTYIVPLLQRATGWTGSAVTPLLVLYGLACVLGNGLGGRGADTWGSRAFIARGLVGLTLGLAGLAVATTAGPPLGRPLVLLALPIFAAAAWSLNPAQARLLWQLAPTAGAQILSLNTSAVYLGTAAGALLGGAVLDSLGIDSVGLTGASVVLVSLVVVTLRSPLAEHRAGAPFVTADN